MSNPNKDAYGWAVETAQRLREGQIEAVDMDALIEELEEMGRSEVNELENRLIVLLAHLLKWQYQPEGQGSSWKGTIIEQRQRIERRLRKSPRLRPWLPELAEEAYPVAITQAYKETGIEPKAFPKDLQAVGWTLEQVLDLDFYPGETQ